MKVAISGRARSGKDTAALWLHKHTSLWYSGSTSRVALPMVFEKFKAIGKCYDSLEECYEDRLSNRKFWSGAIDEYNTPDPCKLYRDCLEVQDILTGIRKRREFEAVKSAGLVHLTIWIGKDDTEDETQEYGPDDCDIAIYNNGTLDQFYGKLKSLSRCLGILRHPTRKVGFSQT